MKHSAVFVLSSAWEGFGNVLAEAMALGTPVVSTDCPSGPREILEGSRWGLLVPVGDPKFLAQAILQTLNNPPKSLPETAWRRFSLEKVVTAYLQVLGISGKVDKTTIGSCFDKEKTEVPNDAICD